MLPSNLLRLDIARTRLTSARRSCISVAIEHAAPLMEEGIASVLRALPDIEVRAVGPEAGAVWSACEVLVADYDTGLKRLGQRRERLEATSGTRVLIVTASMKELDVRAALDTGIDGYQLQDCSFHELAIAVRTLAAGRRHLCSAAAQRVADSLTQATLTGREIEVLRLLVEGLPNKTIAMILGVAVDTVKVHIKHILEKLVARSRSEAISIALRRGLVEDRSEQEPLAPLPASDQPNRMPPPYLGTSSLVGRPA